MSEIKIYKIGGNVIDDEATLASFLDKFSAIKGYKILVHGGGKKATQVGNQLGIETKMTDGRRITDATTLEVVVMVYAGWINKMIVAGLQSRDTNALGLTGADANIITAKQREVGEIDYGFVGDIVSVNEKTLLNFLKAGITPVFCAVTHDANGCLLNTNADTISNHLAITLAKENTVELNYIFEKEGVLSDPADDGTVIINLDLQLYRELLAKQVIHDGMIPKLDNAFQALQAGVASVHIGSIKMLDADAHHYTKVSLS